jgi:hypothetical protein
MTTIFKTYKLYFINLNFSNNNFFITLNKNKISTVEQFADTTSLILFHQDNTFY